MKRTPWTRPSTIFVISLLAGSVAGAALVGGAALTRAPPVSLSLRSMGAGELPELGCGVGQCANVSIEFSGPAALDPAALSVVVRNPGGNISVGGAEHPSLALVYSANQVPHWSASLGGGYYSSYFVADVADPGGHLVGGPGVASIVSGAVLCLKGPYSVSSAQWFELRLSYGGSVATIAVSVW